MTTITGNSQVETVVRKAKGLAAIIPEFLRLWTKAMIVQFMLKKVYSLRSTMKNEL